MKKTIGILTACLLLTGSVQARMPGSAAGSMARAAAEGHTEQPEGLSGAACQTCASQNNSFQTSAGQAGAGIDDQTHLGQAKGRPHQAQQHRGEEQRPFFHWEKSFPCDILSAAPGQTGKNPGKAVVCPHSIPLCPPFVIIFWTGRA